jgi:DNA-binding response OmpR family regulator
MPLSLEPLEALGYVRRAQGTPVVVITERASQEGVLRVLEAGARTYTGSPLR